MSLTRKFLSTLGIEEDKIEEIILKHSETVNGLKDERDSFKEKADKYDKASKELEALKKNSKDDVFKVKYEGIKEEFEEYKKSVKKKETVASKKKLYTDLLKDAKVSEKRIDAILKVTDLESIKIDSDGKLENYDELKENVKKEWDDFIVVEEKKGANVPKPPKTDGKGMTKEQIRKISDPIARQKAMIENPQLFGLKGE